MEEMDLVKEYTIKRYIKDVLKLRTAKTVPDTIRIRLNSIIKKALRESAKLTKADKRTTIMPRDLNPALEKALGKKQLSSQDVLIAIKKLSAIELGDLSREITKHIAQSKQKAK